MVFAAVCLIFSFPSQWFGSAAPCSRHNKFFDSAALQPGMYGERTQNPNPSNGCLFGRGGSCPRCRSDSLAGWWSEQRVGEGSDGSGRSRWHTHAPCCDASSFELGCRHHPGLLRPLRLPLRRRCSQLVSRLRFFEITLEGLVAQLDLERNSSTALIKPSALSWALLRSIFVSCCFSYSLKESPAIVSQSKRNKSPALPQSPPTALQASTGNGEQQADRGDERCAVTA